MKRKTMLVTLLLVGVFAACTIKSGSNEQSNNQTVDQKAIRMKNLISIVEIPVTDFSRAVTFYQAILGFKIEEMEMDGVKMGVLPNNGETVNVVLAKGKDYQPTANGAILYLNAGDDLKSVADKIEQNGGKVIVAKTEISPEMGFFALFIDTEGNKLGLHSTH